MTERDKWRPEWLAWRAKDRTGLAPVDAFYAGWREALESDEIRRARAAERELERAHEALKQFREMLKRYCNCRATGCIPCGLRGA